MLLASNAIRVPILILLVADV